MEMKTTTLVALLASLSPLVAGHGYIIEPPGRSSMWRLGYNTPINYNDNQLFCGGAYNQNYLNRGKCGVCGDPWQGPRENEAGGRYATGTIPRTYTSGQSVTIRVVITANHMGWFEFKLCPNNNPKKAITQQCLDSHVLQRADGQGSKYYITSDTGDFYITVRLPVGLTCTQCVLQWRWHTGNSWGVDPNGKACVGCGPQEEFYGCSDIAITSGGHHPPLVQTTLNPPQTTTTTTTTTKTTTTVKPPPVQTWFRPRMTTRAPSTERPHPHTQTPMPPRPGTKTNISRCFAVNNWAGVPSLDRWCVLSCITQNNCPPIYCRCV